MLYGSLINTYTGKIKTALIAVFLVCRLRFGTSKRLKWYRPDLIATILFFIFANDNESSFLTHSFGFIAGILIGTVMIITGLIKTRDSEIARA